MWRSRTARRRSRTGGSAGRAAARPASPAPPTAPAAAEVDPGVPELLGTAGFATAPLLGRADRRRLRERYDALGLDPDHGFYATSAHAERAVARQVDQLVKAVLGPPLREVLAGWEPFLGAFISKGPLGWNAVELHQDWTYTAEPEVRAVVVWCPLAEARPERGGLQVVPGSHRWSANLRGSGEVPGPLSAVGAALADSPAARPLDLAAGEAALYDAALLHGSPPNAGDDVRVAAAIALAPAGAPLVHLHADPGRPVEGYLIDESYYTLEPYAARPSGVPRHDPDPARLGVVDPDELAGPVAALERAEAG